MARTGVVALCIELFPLSSDLVRRDFQKFFATITLGRWRKAGSTAGRNASLV